MYKEVAQHIPNVSIFPVISLSIFFLFFVGLLIWVFRADKNFVQKMKNIPIDNEKNGAI